MSELTEFEKTYGPFSVFAWNDTHEALVGKYATLQEAREKVDIEEQGWSDEGLRYAVRPEKTIERKMIPYDTLCMMVMK